MKKNNTDRVTALSFIAAACLFAAAVRGYVNQGSCHTLYLCLGCINLCLGAANLFRAKKNGRNGTGDVTGDDKEEK